jgi:glycosyltransferase involved in cell wall biosynthesis
MKNPEKSPKVSVCVVTYNQEKYIRQCLQSIVDQKADFDFEIIVGEDCSTDGTKDIVREFEERYPGVVKPIYQKTNTGATKNYFDTHKAATGEFIAHFDGDDVMLPEKLQLQTNFLNSHVECSFVTHSMININEEGIRLKSNEKVNKNTNLTYKIIEPKTLVRNYLSFNHSSKMYRKKYFHMHDDGDVIDFLLHIEHAHHGWIGYLYQDLGEYRRVSNSMTKVTGRNLWRLFDLTLNGFERARELNYNTKDINYGKAFYTLRAAIFCLEKNDIEGFNMYLEKSVKCEYPLNLYQFIINALKKSPYKVAFLSRIFRLITQPNRA